MLRTVEKDHPDSPIVVQAQGFRVLGIEPCNTVSGTPYLSIETDQGFISIYENVKV